MSANIYYAPQKEYESLGTMAPQQFIAAFEEVFGPLPALLTKDHISSLVAMNAASPNAEWLELLEAVECHGRVRVWTGQ